MRAFVARFAGTCASCEGPIRPADVVQYDDDDELIHNACVARSKPFHGKPEVVCPTCFLTSCDCEKS